MGLVDKIKQDVKRSGQNKGKFIFFREGQKTRIRFLTDMDDGMEVTFHDSFEKSINAPCQDLFGRGCPYCEEEGLRTRSQYIWSVYDYEAKEVKLFMFPVNNCSPVPGLMAMFENYGTLTDRDYVISVSGKGTTKTYSVVPMDKVKFRNEKAKPYAEKAILKMLDKAYPSDGIEDDDDDEEETTSRKRSNKSSKSSGNKKTSSRKKPEPEDDYDDDDYDDDFEDEDEDDWGEDEDEIDYSEMSAQELYKLCKERDIKVPPKKPAKFYIKQLEEYDQAQDDWGEDEDEDDWEDD
ncbi:MAG: hypothetical protein PHN69_06285 [Candidatus Pacebacteria bacterium]|nr:hypothetical protein [Candidatus Paceibacterota bacterium]